VPLVARPGLLDDRRQLFPLLDGGLDTRQRVRRVAVGHHRVAVAESVRADLTQISLCAVESGLERLGRVNHRVTQFRHAVAVHPV